MPHSRRGSTPAPRSQPDARASVGRGRRSRYEVGRPPRVGDGRPVESWRKFGVSAAGGRSDACIERLSVDALLEEGSERVSEVSTTRPGTSVGIEPRRSVVGGGDVPGGSVEGGNGMTDDVVSGDPVPAIRSTMLGAERSERGGHLDTALALQRRPIPA